MVLETESGQYVQEEGKEDMHTNRKPKHGGGEYLKYRQHRAKEMLQIDCWTPSDVPISPTSPPTSAQVTCTTLDREPVTWGHSDNGRVSSARRL